MRPLILMLMVIAVGFTAGAAHAQAFKVRTREASEFDPKFVERAAAFTPSPLMDQPLLIEEDECRIFDSYVRHILTKLIDASNLRAAAKDLKYSLVCRRMSFSLMAQMYKSTMVFSAPWLGHLQSEDAIAWILAHELSHHILRHTDIIAIPVLEYVAAQDEASSEKYQRKVTKIRIMAEREADYSALEILANAGYSYLGAIEVWDFNIGRGGSNDGPMHDPLIERKKLVLRQAAKLRLKTLFKTPFPPEISEAIGRYIEHVEIRSAVPTETKVLEDVPLK